MKNIIQLEKLETFVCPWFMSKIRFWVTLFIVLDLDDHINPVFFEEKNQLYDLEVQPLFLYRSTQKKKKTEYI